MTSNLLYSVWCNTLMCSSNTQLSFKGNEFSRLELHITGPILTTHGALPESSACRRLLQNSQTASRLLVVLHCDQW